MNHRLRPDRHFRFDLPGHGEFDLPLRRLMVPAGERVTLRSDHDPDFTGALRDKDAAAERLADNVRRLSELQEKLYAQDVHALLVIFQALDAAGKDGTIRHVMSGVNPRAAT